MLQAQVSHFDDARVLSLLSSHTYDEVHAMTGWSRGRIYALALRSGARKTEQRIRERQAERRQRQEETLRNLINNTAKADVLDFLDGLPDNSVAMHICSPPYGLGKPYGDCPSADTMRFTFLHGWLMMCISEIARTLKPGGVVCFQVGKTRDWQNQLIPMDWVLAEDFRRAGLTFQSRVIWTQKHGLTPKSRLADRHETIMVFSKGEQATFNPNTARTPQQQPDKRAFKGPRRGELSGHPYGAFPTDVWDDIPQVGHNHPDTKLGKHPAQFPVRLAKRAILLYTLAQDLVCDCFCGSGSSAIAAIETGRNFVGADLFYEDLRAKRVAAAGMDRVTPLPGISDEAVAVWQAEARRVDKTAAALSPADDVLLCRQYKLIA